MPVSVGEAGNRAASVMEYAAATLEASGATVMQSAMVTHRLENVLSAPPPEEDIGGLVARLNSAEEELIEHVAYRRNPPRESARPSRCSQSPRSGSCCSTATREASADLLNICGYVVRAQDDARNTRETEEAARRCLSMFPGWDPDRNRHPPEIIEQILQIRENLPGTLVVRSSADDDRGCAIRVNGAEIGRTPSARVKVPDGAYLVQVECGDQPGRVHRVEVSGETELEVLAGLDATLLSRPRPALVYPSVEALGRLAVDVGALGRAVEAAHVLAVVETADGVVLRSFTGLRGRPRDTGEAELARSASG